MTDNKEKDWTFKYFIKKGWKGLANKTCEIINIGALIGAGVCTIAYLHWIPGIIILGTTYKYIVDTFFKKK